MKKPIVRNELDEMLVEETNTEEIQALLKRPKKRKKPLVEDDEPEPDTDSDTEALQEAFKQGLLKPGLNIPVSEHVRSKVNNVPLLKQRLEEIKLNLDWIEKLDVTSKPAPIAPELSVELSNTTKDQIVHDELKRESVFYRQAQSAVLSVLPKLKQLNIKTQRPEDYYAEMAKSDEHMQKVKVHLIKRKAETERREKIRAVRAQKKLQKALQAQSREAKQSSKKELMDQVKKFRKGHTKDLSFLEDNKKKPSSMAVQKKKKKNVNKKVVDNQKSVGAQSKKSVLKRRYKDDKFGYGGKKRGMKRNTRESTSSMDRLNQKGKKMHIKRPGKSVRNKMKGKKK